MEKMTKVQKFAIVRAIVDATEREDKEMLVDFIDHEVELINKKAANKKATKTQEANEGYKATVVEVLKGMDAPATVSQVLKASDEFADFSTQKVSALLNALVADGVVVKAKDKKVSLFALAETDGESEEVED